MSELTHCDGPNCAENAYGRPHGWFRLDQELYEMVGRSDVGPWDFCSPDCLSDFADAYLKGLIK